MKILVLNGPNLDKLGKRNPSLYDTLTLKELNKLIKSSFSDIKFRFYQTNSEEKIIKILDKKSHKYDALIFNPAAFTHYSVAIYDSLELVKIPVVLVHLSNFKEREFFRKVDIFEPLGLKMISGLGKNSYIQAVYYLKNLLKKL